jgi:inorganic pyrophosphatase
MPASGGLGTADRRGIVIDRPHGHAHPLYPDIIYPCDYGHVPGTIAANRVRSSTVATYGLISTWSLVVVLDVRAARDHGVGSPIEGRDRDGPALGQLAQ